MTRLHVILAGLLLCAVALPDASAQSPGELVAKPYPGAVFCETKGGKPVPNRLGETQHIPSCYLTRDPIEKVVAFYAQAGLKLAPITVKADQNVPGDQLYYLELALQLQLERGAIGAMYAVAMEYVETRGADDEASYFNGIVVETRRPKPKFDQAPKDIIMAYHESSFLMPMYMFLELQPDEDTVRLYNRHLALPNAFFPKTDGKSLPDVRGDELVMRMMQQSGKLDRKKRLELADAHLEQLEKEAYRTRILIQVAEKSPKGRDRNPESVANRWRSAVGSDSSGKAAK